MAIKNLKDQFTQGVSFANETAGEAKEKIEQSKEQKRKIVSEIKKKILHRTKGKKKILIILLMQITSRQTVLDQILAQIFNEEKNCFRVAKVSIHKNLFIEKLNGIADIKSYLLDLNYLIDDVIVFSVSVEDDEYCISATPSVPVAQETNY